MVACCRSVPLNAIKFIPDWNLHPWHFGTISPELLDSFKAVGVIHPPLLLSGADETFTILAGARRLEFIRRNPETPRADCLVVSQGTTPLQLLQLILADQLTALELTLAEKARFIEIASRYLSTDQILASFQSNLRLSGGRAAALRLLSLLDQDQEIIEAVHRGLLTERMVAELLLLPHDKDRLALVRLFNRLAMGDGKQRRFFGLLRDLSGKEGVSIDAYLRHEGLAAILDHPRLNIPQKIQHLGTLLHRQLNPGSSRAEENFAKRIQRLKLPATHAIAHTPSFETEAVTLTIQFKNLEECERYLGQAPGDR